MNGAKALNLIRLRDEFWLYVPPFVVVPFHDVLKVTRKTITINETALNRLHQQLKQFDWSHVSFRTSALQEDGATVSFAGQFESFVDVPYSKKALRTYIVACYESTRSKSVHAYAKKHAIQVVPGASVFYDHAGYVWQSESRVRIHYRQLNFATNHYT